MTILVIAYIEFCASKQNTESIQNHFFVSRTAVHVLDRFAHRLTDIQTDEKLSDPIKVPFLGFRISI